jgi:heme/copper-type cytochrome/quinol oxidase subunit 2
MWFIWVIWGLLALMIVVDIILLTGRGSNLVTGFNTMSKEEKSQYDKVKVSRQTGVYMLFINIGLIALVTYLQFRVLRAIRANTINSYGTEITIIALAICAYIVVIGLAGVVRGFKNCKK